MTTKTIAITMGDPLGIGPEIVCKALISARLPLSCQYVVAGEKSVFKKHSSFKRLLKMKNVSFCWTTDDGRRTTRNKTGLASLLSLQTATNLVQRHQADALVTAPICKEHVQLAGFKFPGHTEFLADAFGVKKFAMMFCAPQFRVVLSTIHVPLCDVPKLLTADLVFDKLMLTAQSLQSLFKIKRPRIAVCGLNPHAGEHGLMGEEEKEIILPTINKFIKSPAGKQCRIDGPLSADGLFGRLNTKKYDAILCHYHDQGLIPIKLLARNSAVNLTLGLPFIRTSPAHGTAFDIAGKNKADPRSMIEAIKLAAKLS